MGLRKPTNGIRVNLVEALEEAKKLCNIQMINTKFIQIRVLQVKWI